MSNKYGLTDERYQWFIEHDVDDEWIRQFIEDWGIDAVNKGYDIFEFNFTGILEIEKIDDLQIFESDKEAVEQAIKDGVKIIPLDELPKEMVREGLFYLGWIDTPENRKAIEDYCEMQNDHYNILKEIMC